MGNFNNEKNNNKRKFNNKNNKQKRVNPKEVKLPVYLPADLNEDIYNEIVDLLNTTKFNKISIPVNISRHLINPDDTSNKVSVIGYIRNYNPETTEFTIILFDNLVEPVKNLGDIAMAVVFNTYKEKFTNIARFEVIPVTFEPVFTEDEEVNK